MKIHQEVFFKPITITLETAAEAESLIMIIEAADGMLKPACDAQRLGVEISNVFTNALRF